MNIGERYTRWRTWFAVFPVILTNPLFVEGRINPDWDNDQRVWLQWIERRYFIHGGLGLLFSEPQYRMPRQSS